VVFWSEAGMGDQTLSKIYNYLKLSDDIVTSGQPSEEDFAAIAAAGYQVVINLGLLNTDYALADEEKTVEALGLSCIHIPVQWENPTRADLEAFFQAIERCSGKRIYVHCAANMRVSVFMALYRVLHLGWSLDKAMEDVREIWEPNPIWQGFIDQVISQHDLEA
jgi:uncharacterized protein (TIGR01244 family)